MLTHSTKDVAFVFRKLVGDEINPGFLQSAYLLFKASPKRVDELVHCCRYYGIPPARPPRAKTTRWDSILKAADTDSAIAPALFGWSAAHSATDAGALGLVLHSMQHVFWYFGVAMLQDALLPLRIVSKVHIVPLSLGSFPGSGVADPPCTVRLRVPRCRQGC